MGITTETGDLAITATNDIGLAQDSLYERVSSEFAAPLARLACAHEADPSLQQDLLQEGRHRHRAGRSDGGAWEPVVPKGSRVASSVRSTPWIP